MIAFTWNAHPRWRLLLIGNRDEAHARPSAPLARWPEDPALIAGRDLEAGGTWMGVHEPGRAAVVTNVRDPGAAHEGVSRGLLVTDFLSGANTARGHADAFERVAAGYRPFNLLLFDREDARFVSNHPRVRTQEIPAGLHGLSNGELDSPWPKVRRATEALRRWIEEGTDHFDALFPAFLDTTPAPDAELPKTGVGLGMERHLSPLFVRGERYGTRATTLIALDRDGGGCIIEQRFGADGVPKGRTVVRLGDMK